MPLVPPDTGIVQGLVNIVWATELDYTGLQNVSDYPVVSGANGLDSFGFRFSFGTGPGNVNKQFHKQLQIPTGGSTQTIDLTNVKDRWLNPFKFTLVKLFLIRMLQNNGPSVRIGAASNWAALWSGSAKGEFLQGYLLLLDPVDGYAVGGGNSTLTFPAGSVPLNIDVVALGEGDYF